MDMVDSRHIEPTSTTDSSLQGWDLRQLIDTLNQSRWLIAGITVFAAVASIVAATLSTPIYRANALLQVEERAQAYGGLDELTSAITGDIPASAEIEVLRSRSVLGPVVDAQSLDKYAKPVWFPFIGRAFARLRDHNVGVRTPFLGIDGYAWGGERIRVDRFDVPVNMQGSTFVLTAADNERYTLHAPNEQLVFEGEVAETATLDDGRVSLYVSRLEANPGTRFELARIPQSRVLVDLQRRLRVSERGKQSGILEVSLQGEEPERIARIVDAVVTTYVRQNVERRSEEARKSLEFISEQLPTLKAELDAAETRLNQYRSAKGALDIGLQTQAVIQQITELEKQRADLAYNRGELSRRFTENHPVFAALSENDARLAAKLDELNAEIQGLPETEQEFVRLARDVEVNKELYVLLLNKAQELKVVQAGTVGNVRILDSAAVLPDPVRPRRTLMVVVGTLVGLLAGIALAMMRASLRRHVEDPRVIEEGLGLPVYASIPHSTDQRTNQRRFTRKRSEQMPVLAFEAPNDVAVESFRSLRTSIEFAMADAPNNILAISGPCAEVGKSFISANISAVLSTAGKKVLLIDADMRRGHLHDYFGVERAPGLSELLSGQATAEQAIRANLRDGVNFLPPGERPPNPAELLMNQRFTSMLARFQEDFDTVVIDTPPVLAVTDGVIIGKESGLVFLVARSGRHTLDELAASLKRLRQNGVTVSGFIFNDQRLSAAGYYGYGNYAYVDTP